MSHLPCLLFPPGIVHTVLIGKPASGALLAGFLLLSQKTWPDKKQPKEESFLLAQENIFHLGKNDMAISRAGGWLAGHITSTGRKTGVINRTFNYLYPFCSDQDPSPENDTGHIVWIFPPQWSYPIQSSRDHVKGLPSRQSRSHETNSATHHSMPQLQRNLSSLKKFCEEVFTHFFNTLKSLRKSEIFLFPLMLYVDIISCMPILQGSTVIWEIRRSKEWNPHGQISDSMKEYLEILLAFFSTNLGHDDKVPSVTQGMVFTRYQTCWHSDLRFSGFQNYEEINEMSVFS